MKKGNGTRTGFSRNPLKSGLMSSPRKALVAPRPAGRRRNPLKSGLMSSPYYRPGEWAERPSWSQSPQIGADVITPYPHREIWECIYTSQSPQIGADVITSLCGSVQVPPPKVGRNPLKSGLMSSPYKITLWGHSLSSSRNPLKSGLMSSPPYPYREIWECEYVAIPSNRG